LNQLSVLQLEAFEAEIPRKRRSGFRRAARTPRKRLKLPVLS